MIDLPDDDSAAANFQLELENRHREETELLKADKDYDALLDAYIREGMRHLEQEDPWQSWRDSIKEHAEFKESATRGDYSND